MNWLKITKFFILLTIVFVIGYDILAYKEGTVDATISRITLAFAHRWPLVPFSVGILVGHLFWPQPQSKG